MHLLINVVNNVAGSQGMETSMKLMKKMGWSEGKGLGSSLQGITEPVKLKQSVDNKGGH